MNITAKLTCTLIITFITLQSSAQAVTVNIPQQLTKGMSKGQFIERQSQLDNAKKATYMQADMIFAQTCGITATEVDLARISKTDEFNKLYSILKAGRAVGFSESKKILVENKKTYCKDNT